MKLKIKYPVICEGKYDKIKLSSVLDCMIITTDGFGIFSSSEKSALLRRLARHDKIIVATDSDGAGLVIRNFIRGFIPADRLINVYIPQIKGKERRKATASAAGTLGVEGMDAEYLRTLFAPFAGEGEGGGMSLTKADFYALGLSGGECSAKKRAMLCREAELPDNMSCTALLEAVNLMLTPEKFYGIMEKINGS